VHLIWLCELGRRGLPDQVLRQSTGWCCGWGSGASRSGMLEGGAPPSDALVPATPAQRQPARSGIRLGREAGVPVDRGRC
jgi:hypothetical protein